MKVAFFTASINIGGIERVFITYATGLQKLGYDVNYITCWSDGSLSGKITNGITVHGLGNIRLRNSIWRLSGLLLKIKPDVIITGNDSTMVVYFAKLLSGLRNLKIITSQHSYLNNSETLFYSKPIVKWIFPKCEKIISVSKGIEEMLANDYKLRAPKVVLLNNPINWDLIQQESLKKVYDVPQEKFVVFVGRMTPVKNLPFLIDSFVKFRILNPEYTLLLIGDGYVRKEIEKYVSKKGASTFVKFAGVKSNPYPYIKKASCLILPSTSEAFPTVLIEAMSLGVTCVATPTNGVIDILENGRLGYVSSSFTDSDEFAHLLCNSIAKPFEAKLLIGQVRRKYGLNAKSDELSTIIQSL